MRAFPFALSLLLLLSGCSDEGRETQDQPIIRGLKTILVQKTEETTTRRYPSVLQPSAISTLSFEIAGRLKNVDLDVGQIVKKGDVLAQLDTQTLEIQVESAEAALREAKTLADNAAEDAKRKAELFEKRVISKSTADDARTEAQAAAARTVQAQRGLDDARENLTKADLLAPFDGIINSVEVDSFANVAAGSAIATLYDPKTFETRFSVSFDVVNKLAVGKKVKIRLADNPDIVLKGHVSELGARADTVSSFPVVVALDAVNPLIKAGMAVEIAIDFMVPSGEGFALPLSVLPFEGKIKRKDHPDEPGKTQVFVFDEKTSTVHRRDVWVAGVKENAILIVKGLKVGDRVASAGVSFLRDGEKVKLLKNDTK